MNRPITLEEYLCAPERPHAELIFGFLRAAPPLLPLHATLVERVRSAVARHLQETDRGTVHDAPLDVVLYAGDPHGLILHPALAAVVDDRRERLRERVFWGAPSLVVEVLTPRTARRTRSSKMRWYRMWGVQECWCLDTRTRKIEVLDLQAGLTLPHIYSGRALVRSPLLPSFTLEPFRIFA